jgi:hypothetical protein
MDLSNESTLDSTGGEDYDIFFSAKPFASSLHQIKQITEQGLVVPSHDLGVVSAVHGSVFRVANAIGTCSDATLTRRFK